MSKRILLLVLTGTVGMMLGVSGCKASQEGDEAKKGAEVTQSTEDTQPQQKPLYDGEGDEKLKKEILVRGELPPVIEVGISVKSVSGNLSKVDADRAKLFSKSEIELCYRNALVSDRELAVTMDLRITVKGDGVIESVAFDPEVKDGKFLACLESAGRHFRLPKTRDGERGEAEYELSFKSKAGPTMEEVIEENRGGKGGHQHH